MTSLSILIVGLLLGMKHATEADHLAAVATLATGQNSLAQTIRQGVAWGIGHTLTLALFGALAAETGVAGQLDWAQRHAEVIRRFGRFPHRNALLRRPSTPEETEYLRLPGSGF